MQHPIKLFACDLNWSRQDSPVSLVYPSLAHEWAFVDPAAYFDFHREMGVNVMFCQAFTFGGYAFYPTKLGPVAPGPGSELLPRLFEQASRAGMPFWSYFCVGTDVTVSAKRSDWVIPGSQRGRLAFLGPETGWTDLLCARVREFLSMVPVDWLLFDWFFYGSWTPGFQLQPASFVRQPFREIIGREMPDQPAEITPEESLRYQREVLASQFYRLRDTVKETSPATKILFNVPYEVPAHPLWTDHPMLNESDGLFAECSREAILEWLLGVRRPNQRVMTTIIGRLEEGVSEPHQWRNWYDRGCDFCGYTFGTPPDFRPHASYERDLEVVRQAFRAMP